VGQTPFLRLQQPTMSPPLLLLPPPATSMTTRRPVLLPQALLLWLTLPLLLRKASSQHSLPCSPASPPQEPLKWHPRLRHCLRRPVPTYLPPLVCRRHTRPPRGGAQLPLPRSDATAPPEELPATPWHATGAPQGAAGPGKGGGQQVQPRVQPQEGLLLGGWVLEGLGARGGCRYTRGEAWGMGWWGGAGGRRRE